MGTGRGTLRLRRGLDPFYNASTYTGVGVGVGQRNTLGCVGNVNSYLSLFLAICTFMSLTRPAPCMDTALYSMVRINHTQPFFTLLDRIGI